MKNRSLPEVLRWIAARILTPDKGDSHDHRYTQCSSHVNRLLFFRRHRSCRASHRLCQTRVAADRQTVSGPRHLWSLAAIPGKGKTPVITTLSPLAFRKHQCDNTPLAG